MIVFQELVSEVGVQRSEFEQLLSSCDLLETPFDQSQFESDVSQLQAKMDDCDKVCVCVCVGGGTGGTCILHTLGREVSEHYVIPDALFKYDLFFSSFNSSII